MYWTAIVWLILMLVFLLAEAATVSLVSLWFAVGALLAAIVSLLGGAVWLQVSVFVLSSAILLVLLRPMVRKFVNPGLTPTNVDSVIGSTGLVTADIDNVAAAGQVKLGAMFWTARSTSGASIPSDTLVRVDRVEGVKVYVSPAPEEAKI